ncbi:hypothetical protein E2C01_045631 [Portunus trituberculatus]|uniref:Uncharacterized protein n=1 Tax=Portunus trituberculatus TaxID=210409 RepID=A0A5B7G1Q3_PORTR|nr:hypothetical protein [Portunus trituberculatus]
MIIPMKYEDSILRMSLARCSSISARTGMYFRRLMEGKESLKVSTALSSPAFYTPWAPAGMRMHEPHLDPFFGCGVVGITEGVPLEMYGFGFLTPV